MLAFIDDDPTQAAVAGIKQAAEELRDECEWVIGPPYFVDETEQEGDRTVGIVLELYSAYDESGEILDPEIDRRHLEEVLALIHAAEKVSADNGIAIGFELNQDSVGWIDAGRWSEDLRAGLVEPWAARFEL
jgi:hypothetical protein